MTLLHILKKRTFLRMGFILFNFVSKKTATTGIMLQFALKDSCNKCTKMHQPFARCWFQNFLIHVYLEKWFPFEIWTNLFQMGWNHPTTYSGILKLPQKKSRNFTNSVVTITFITFKLRNLQNNIELWVFCFSLRYLPKFSSPLSSPFPPVSPENSPRSSTAGREVNISPWQRPGPQSNTEHQASMRMEAETVLIIDALEKKETPPKFFFGWKGFCFKKFFCRSFFFWLEGMEFLRLAAMSGF